MYEIMHKLNFFKSIITFCQKIKYKKVQKAELKWWRKKGLTQGTKHYALYYKVFRLDSYDFSDSVFIDVGGGMHPIHLEITCKRKILIDPLINSYMKIEGYIPSKEVEYYQSFEQLDEKRSFADVVSCFNTLDHAFDPANVISDIYTGLKKDGLFFVYSYIGNPLGGPQHPHCFFREDYLSFLEGKFRIIEEIDLEKEEIKKINRFPAFAAVCRKI